MIENYKDIYKKLVAVRGADEQLGYFYEEIGELLQAINKYKRADGRITKFDIFWRVNNVSKYLYT
jgi:NTP pyrophosphatase (non-canonical NTP hydrolase)